MGSKIFEKASVEEIPLGALSLSINGASIWNQENRAQRLFDYLNNIFVDLTGKEQIPACVFLRLVSVANDIASEIGRWQQQLGRPVDVSTDELGEVGGKTLTWGDGGKNTTFAVIVVAEHLALGMLDEGPSKVRELCTGMFIHELAHVHDDWRCIKTFGPIHPISATDWAELCREIAINMWSEFHAESVACGHVGSIDADAHVSLAVDYIRKSTQEIGQAIAKYRFHGNMPTLWNLAISELAKTLNQVGRVVGQLSCGDNDRELQAFFDKVNEMSNEWGSLVRQLPDEFRLITDTRPWATDTFSTISAIVKKSFHINGLYPKDQDKEEGLWVSVP